MSDDMVLEVCGVDGMWQLTNCASSDDACVGSCEVYGGVAQCLVEAVDADGDSVGSSECSEVPGRDCDDSNPAVYAGAREVCDWVDNDCDGKVDLNDGLSLAGEITGVQNLIHPSIAWSYEAQKFGWVATNQRQLFLGTLDTNGYVDEPEAPFRSVTPEVFNYTPFDLAYADDSGAFGVIYSQLATVIDPTKHIPARWH